MTRIEQEPDVVPWRGVLISLVATLVTIALGTLVAWAIEAAVAGAAAPAVPATTALADHSAMERAPFDEDAQGLAAHAAAERALERYGWVDRARGIVHIPIDVAIDLVIARQEATR